MRLTLTASALALLIGSPSLAQSAGDAAAGEKGFRKCQACHVVEAPDGTVLAGKSGRSGPNLYGIVGRQAGTVDGFKYRPDIVTAGEAGLTWDEESLAAYLLDPSGFLQETLGDSSVRSGMSFRLRKDQEAADMAAYLASLAQE